MLRPDPGAQGVLPFQTPTTMHCPSYEELDHVLSTLGLLAGLSPPVGPAEGDNQSRHALGLLWMGGQAVPFLRPVKEWWAQAAARELAGVPSHSSTRFCPIVEDQ